jgi:hypothetical protein
MRSAPVSLAVVIAAIGFVGCSADAEVSIGGTSIDTAEAEQEVSSGLADAYGDPPKTLTCPDDIDAAEGETFVCEGVSPDPESRPFEIEVTMTDDEGGIRYPTQVTFTGDRGASS